MTEPNPNPSPQETVSEIVNTSWASTNQPTFDPESASTWQAVKSAAAQWLGRVRARNTESRDPLRDAPTRYSDPPVLSSARQQTIVEPVIDRPVDRITLLCWIDDFPDTEFAEMDNSAINDAAAQIRNNLDRNVLSPAETDRARVVVTAMVEDAMEGISFTHHARALIVLEHRFRSWKQARPFLRDTAQSANRATLTESVATESLDAVVLARPRALTAASPTHTANSPVPAGAEPVAAIEPPAVDAAM
ncbi:hypothetical protein AB0C34_18020 [Nocardia sp. NPDC049220]|uniref:hypothetical protein n=1 Tax=Nocardia sp. NPDC049220 TaxID=3155273 RepID=UPI00340DA35B